MAESKNSPATISIAEALTRGREPRGGLGAFFFGGPIYKALVDAGVQPDVAEAAQLHVDEKVHNGNMKDLYEAIKKSTKIGAEERARLGVLVDHLSNDLTILNQVQQRIVGQLKQVEKIAVENKPDYHKVLSQQDLLNDRYDGLFKWGRTIIGAILVAAIMIVADHFELIDKLSSLGIKFNG